MPIWWWHNKHGKLFDFRFKAGYFRPRITKHFLTSGWKDDLSIFFEDGYIMDGVDAKGGPEGLDCEFDDAGNSGLRAKVLHEITQKYPKLFKNIEFIDENLQQIML